MVEDIILSLKASLDSLIEADLPTYTQMAEIERLLDVIQLEYGQRVYEVFNDCYIKLLAMKGGTDQQCYETSY